MKTAPCFPHPPPFSHNHRSFCALEGFPLEIPRLARSVSVAILAFPHLSDSFSNSFSSHYTQTQFPPVFPFVSSVPQPPSYIQTSFLRSPFQTFSTRKIDPTPSSPSTALSLALSKLFFVVLSPPGRYGVTYFFFFSAIFPTGTIFVDGLPPLRTSGIFPISKRRFLMASLRLVFLFFPFR